MRAGTMQAILHSTYKSLEKHTNYHFEGPQTRNLRILERELRELQVEVEAVDNGDVSPQRVMKMAEELADIGAVAVMWLDKLSEQTQTAQRLKDEEAARKCQQQESR